MLDVWCGESGERPPIKLVGRIQDRKVPSEMYGMISALLLRSGEMGEDIAEALGYLGFPLPGGPFQVVLFSLDDPRIGALRGRIRHNCRVNMYAALRDHLAERLQYKTQGWLVMLMGYLFGIFYTGGDDTVVARVCGESVGYAKDVLGFDVHVTISNPWEGVDKVESAYRIIQDAEHSREFYTGVMDRVFIIPSDALQRIVDRDQRTQFEQTFFQSAERVCGAVQAGDCQVAARYLQEQLQKIAENCIGMPYPTTLNLTINRFLSLLQYRLVDQNLADWRYVSKMDFSRDLVSSPDLAAYLAVGKEIAEKLVEHARERTQRRYDSMMHDIRAYVEENATDMNMGLTSVARAFRIKPREAAESFRQYFGESINDVLHKSRVKKAKELLLTTDEPVQDIAAAVGYCSLATMYRAFANVEGVAPGKLRQNRSR